MIKNDEGQRVFDRHCDSLAKLASLLMRTSAGGTGTENIGGAILDAAETLNDLMEQIDNRNIVDYGLCDEISRNLSERLFEYDSKKSAHLFNGGLDYGLKLAAYKMGGAMAAHISRAETGLSEWADNRKERMGFFYGQDNH